MQDIMQQVRNLQIRTKRQVSDVLSGAYLSVFKGSGVEFDEVRPYVPGDDVRSIDWNVTARTGVPHIKRFVEERELSIMLLIDISSSQQFGSTRSKQEIAAEFASLIAFSAIANQDKIGLILFSDTVEKSIPVRKGQRHVLRLLREILSYEQEQEKQDTDTSWLQRWKKWLFQSRKTTKKTSIAEGVEFCRKILSRKSVVFVISDFLDQDYWKAIQIANQKHDVVLVRVIDSYEGAMPNVGVMCVEDMETGERLVVDSTSTTLTDFTKVSNALRMQEVEHKARNIGIDLIKLETHKTVIDPLLEFMKMREKRKK